MAARSRFGRVISGTGGQLFARGTLILYQLLTVPLLIAAWGVEQFGAWLALTALVGLASNANFGVLNAFSVEIQTIGVRDDPDRLSVTTHTASLVLALLLGPVAALFCAAAWLLPLEEWLNIAGVSPATILAVVVLVLLRIWADNLRAVSAAVIIARGRYGLPNLIVGGFQLIEIGAIAALVLVLDGTMVHAAAAGTVASIASLVVHRQVAGPPDRGRFDWALVQRLLSASLGNFVLSVGVNSLTVHGTRLALSAFLGPRALAAYAVTMTAVKAVDQLNGAFVSTLQSEFSRIRAIGTSDESLRLLILGGQVALLSFLLFAAGLLAFGPIAFDAWTQGAVGFSSPLALLLLVGILLMQAGKAAQYYLLGNNRVLAFGLAALASCALGLLVAVVLMPTWGILGAGAGFTAGELLTLLAATTIAARHLGLAPTTLLRRTLDLRPLIDELAPRLRRGLSR